MLIRNVATILLFSSILPTLATAQLSKPCQNKNKIVCQVMQKLSCSEEEAEEFVVYVTKKVTRLQIFLSRLASEQYHIEHKEIIINYLLKEVFTADAIVTVSSVNNSERVIRLSIKDYLYRLANLSKTYAYESARLYFSPDFLNLAGFEYFSEEGYYEMLIKVKQFFEGQQAKGGYADVTYKNLACEIKQLKEGEFHLRWKSIQVEGTSTVSPEELVRELKEFDEYITEYFKKLGAGKR